MPFNVHVRSIGHKLNCVCVCVCCQNMKFIPVGRNLNDDMNDNNDGDDDDDALDTEKHTKYGK